MVLNQLLFCRCKHCENRQQQLSSFWKPRKQPSMRLTRKLYNCRSQSTIWKGAWHKKGDPRDPLTSLVVQLALLLTCLKPHNSSSLLTPVLCVSVRDDFMWFRVVVWVNSSGQTPSSSHVRLDFTAALERYSDGNLTARNSRAFANSVKKSVPL